MIGAGYRKAATFQVNYKGYQFPSGKANDFLPTLIKQNYYVTGT